MNRETSRKWISAGAGVLFLVLNSAALEITPEFTIVKGKTTGLPAENSSIILADHLEKIFGMRPKIIDSAVYNGKAPAILLVEDRTLEPEEWSIRAEGKNLRIAGGYPRGLHYGCAEFLEKFGGVRWFTYKHCRIPKAKSITVPDGRDFRRKPAFPLLRDVYAAIQGRPHSNFLSMNKNHYRFRLPSSKSGSTLYTSGGIGPAHSFYKLTVAVPKDREDMLPIDSNGKRLRALRGRGPGQICYANRDFREFAKKEIGKWIEKHKAVNRGKKLDEKNPLRWIVLTQNDNGTDCVCSGCRELVRKYGTPAGALLDFINDMASAYPEYLFQTLAYYQTVEPPKHIRPRDNVLIQFAFLGDRKGYYDTIRPLSHPVNAQLIKWYREWDKIASNKAVWGYHRLYRMTEAFPWPQACFWYIGEDMRFYRDIGARTVFIESEFGNGGDRAFHDLHVYLAAKLMDNPDADEKKLTDEFFDFQYGPAAPEMRAYADYLKKRLEAIPGKICGTPLQGRSCFDPEFFRTINNLLDQAEAKVKNDPERLENVQIERVPVDYAALHLWQRITSKTGMNREALLDRLEKNLQLNLDRYYGKANEQNPQKARKRFQALQDTQLRLLRTPIPIPPGMENLDIRQISSLCETPRFLVDDPDAALGKAVKLKEFSAKSRFTHATQPMVFGVYNNNTEKILVKRIIKPEEVPSDEKYHLYRIGIVVPSGYEKYYFWGHRSWTMNISRLYEQLWDPMDPDREYELYISCKLTGPAYVKGSKSENAVYVDKLVAVKRGIRPSEMKEKKTKARLQLPVPEEFKGKKIIQISALKANPNFVVADSDSVCGKAVKLGEFPPGSRFTHATQPMVFGLYNDTARKSEARQTIASDQVPPDEKYHFYKLGKVIRRKDAKQNLWGHRTWVMQINRLFNALPPGEYELYVSFKLTGPAYVKGSKKENAVYTDRIIAVCLASQNDKKPGFNNQSQ